MFFVVVFNRKKNKNRRIQTNLKACCLFLIVYVTRDRVIFITINFIKKTLHFVSLSSETTVEMTDFIGELVNNVKVYQYIGNIVSVREHITKDVC